VSGRPLVERPDTAPHRIPRYRSRIMKLPERITGDWMDSLENDRLLDAELSLHGVFSKLERAEKKRLGEKYDMMKGSPELLDAWGRWSRVNNEARVRGLHMRRASR
jgi:hypothetical protein